MMIDSINIEAEVQKETEAAWLIDINGEGMWLPKSQVEKTTWEGSSSTSFEIPIWLAEKIGIV